MKSKRAIMRVLRATLAALMIGLPMAAESQVYPARAVRLTVPGEPGIAQDLFARLLASRLSTSLGQPVVVENRGGAGGSIGVGAVGRSAPDGYSILFASALNIMTAAQLAKDLTYDPTALTPVTAVMDSVILLVMRPTLPFTNLNEVVAHARANPGKLTYGSSGRGSIFHLVAESINDAARVNILHVPYKNILQSVADVMTGQIDLSFGTPASLRQHIAGGKVKVLAVIQTTRTRAKAFPDTPAITELLPGIELPANYWAIWGPPGMPGAIVARLHPEIVKATASPDLRNWLDTNGFTYIGSSPEELRAMHKNGMAQYLTIFKKLGIQPQ
jgi:tripartite-type tricarboxylate transporter receptor subunit TctC